MNVYRVQSYDTSDQDRCYQVLQLGALVRGSCMHKNGTKIQPSPARAIVCLRGITQTGNAQEGAEEGHQEGKRGDSPSASSSSN